MTCWTATDHSLRCRSCHTIITNRPSGLGPHGPSEVGERGDRVGEEHHPEPADHDVEARRREGMALGVGLLEGGVVQPVRVGRAAGSVDHRRGDVYPGHPSGHRQARGVTRRLPGTAPDVEHVIVGTNVVGAAQHLVMQPQFCIVVDAVNHGHT